VSRRPAVVVPRSRCGSSLFETVRKVLEMSETLWLFLVSTPKPRDAAPPIELQDTDETETKQYAF